MKLFHLSDLHIGKQLHHYNLAAEQRKTLAQIVALAKSEHPDAILIAGDIYDTPVPSAEAVSVFDAFLSALCEIEPQIAVMIIAGNHDSARRIDFASSILAKHEVYIAGLPPMQEGETIRRVTLADGYGEVDFYLLPFVKPGYVRKLFDEEIKGYDMAVRRLIEREEIDSARRCVILSHQFYTAGGKEPATCDSEIHYVGGVENVDAGVLAAVRLCALGTYPPRTAYRSGKIPLLRDAFSVFRQRGGGGEERDGRGTGRKGTAARDPADSASAGAGGKKADRDAA